MANFTNFDDAANWIYSCSELKGKNKGKKLEAIALDKLIDLCREYFGAMEFQWKNWCTKRGPFYMGLRLSYNYGEISFKGNTESTEFFEKYAVMLDAEIFEPTPEFFKFTKRFKGLIQPYAANHMFFWLTADGDYAFGIVTGNRNYLVIEKSENL